MHKVARKSLINTYMSNRVHLHVGTRFKILICYICEGNNHDRF